MTEQQKIFTPITQAEAGYVEISPNMPTQACANCRWFRRGYTVGGGFDPTQDYCQLVENTPKDIENVGWCNRWEAPPEMEPMGMADMVIETDNVTIVEMAAGSKELEDKLSQPGVLERLLKAIKNVMGRDSPVRGFKALPGSNLWVAWYSNNFEDRERQIISAKAHDDYIQRLDSRLIPMPELWFYHIPGTRHGKALWVDRIDNMVVAVGEFDETPIAKRFKAHYDSGVEYKVSHGFRADSKDLRDYGDFEVWEQINTFEISPLPNGKEANVYTLFTEVKTMAMNDEKYALLESIVGKDVATEIAAQSKERSKQVADLGERYKDFTEPEAATEESAESKALASLKEGIGPALLDLVEGLGDLTITQGAAAKEAAQLSEQVKSLTETNAELVKRLEALEGTAAQMPRSVKTLTEGGTEPTQEQQNQVKEFDPFFGDLGVLKNG